MFGELNSLNPNLNYQLTQILATSLHNPVTSQPLTLSNLRSGSNTTLMPHPSSPPPPCLRLTHPPIEHFPRRFCAF